VCTLKSGCLHTVLGGWDARTLSRR
jgi:hypothetical protein